MAADGEGTPFDYEARVHISRSLTRWAEVHPRPDDPVLEVADGSQLTPRTIAAAARAQDSRAGALIYSMFALAVEDRARGPHELERILGVFDRDAERWTGHNDFEPPETMGR